MTSPRHAHLSSTSSNNGEPGPLIVLVHGAMDRSASFARTIRHLHGSPVLRYDRRGYGRSYCEAPAGLDQHVDDLEAIIGDCMAVVVGHSFGGVIALSAAERMPEQILAVGAFETPMMWRSWWPQETPGNAAVSKVHGGRSHEDAGETFMINLIGEQRWMDLPAKVKDDRRREGATLVAELTSIDHTCPPWDPQGLQFPVLAGYGTGSKPYLIRAAKTLAEEAPLGECMVIDDAGHSAHMSHPKQFAEFVRRVLHLGLVR